MNNTSPSGMLDLPAEKLEQLAGDSAAGFWTAQIGALDRLQPGDRGWTAPGIYREAYSWGGLARTSPDPWGPGVLKTITGVLGRIGWLTLIPFGLANIAYWTRRLPAQSDGADGTPRGDKGWAGLARLFALGLTLLFVVTICDVSLDVVARQCFPGGKLSCGKLSGVIGFANHWPLSHRLAVASLVPVAVLLGMLWVVVKSGTRYEAVPSKHLAIGGPMIGRRNFWSGVRMLRGLVPVHLAASLAVIVLTTAPAGWLGKETSCRALGEVVHQSCRDEVLARLGTPFAIITLIAVILLVIAGILLVARASDAPDIRADAAPPWWQLHGPLVLLGLSVLLLVAELLFLWLLPESLPPGCSFLAEKDSSCPALPGILAAPTVLTAGLLGVAASAGLWRATSAIGGVGGWRVPAVAVAVPVLLMSPVIFLPDPVFSAPVLVRVLAVLVVLAVALASGWPVVRQLFAPAAADAETAQVAWRGKAPAVFQLAAVVAALLLSSLVTLTFGDWLNDTNSPLSLIDAGRQVGPGPQITLPPTYVWFAVMVVGTLLLTAIGGVAIGVVTVWGPPGNAKGASVADNPLRKRQEAARRFAAFTQRAEPLVALVACIGVLLATGAVVASAARWQPWQGRGSGASWGTFLASMSSTAVALVGLAAVLALVGGKATGGKRPFGLLWDLICVVPRAAHPLGPPCYAERAVPELSRRCQAWLTPADAAEAGQRRVILSAHSLGSVLAVAVVLGLPDQLQSRVGLLTYGSQLRAYFGRIFPELLGARVLGNTACSAPSVWSGDPWVHQQPPAPELPAPPPPTLTSILDVDTAGALPRWRSLWRRTDYIGFAVFSYLPNEVDSPAQEYDDGNYQLSVVSHSDYPRATEYQDAIEELRVALI